MAKRKKAPAPPTKRGPGRPTKITPEAVSYMVRLLARRAHKHEAFALIRHRYGCGNRTCEAILTRARAVQALETGRSRPEMRADSFEFYISVIRDPESTVAEKMHAQGRIDSLYGLNAPQEHRHGGSEDAGPIRHAIAETVVTTREEAAELLKGPSPDGTPIIGAAR